MNTRSLARHAHARLDYLLIWGHGTPHRHDILSMLEAKPWCDIQKVVAHEPKNIGSLVKHIYSFDYAPFEHLKGKVKYLLNTPSEVMFVFFNNLEPQVDFYGEGKYRHLESMAIRGLKEEIRDRFNPRRANGERSEDHVIHVTDNESQSDYALKYLGFEQGVSALSQRVAPVPLPHHLKTSKSATIKAVPMESLFCNIAKGEPSARDSAPCNLSETPHFKAFVDNFESYRQYLHRYLGYTLQDYYTVEKYRALHESGFEYLRSPFENNYIVVRPHEEGYMVLDGLHRAALCKQQGMKSVKVAVLYEND